MLTNRPADLWYVEYKVYNYIKAGFLNQPFFCSYAHHETIILVTVMILKKKDNENLENLCFCDIRVDNVYRD